MTALLCWLVAGNPVMLWAAQGDHAATPTSTSTPAPQATPGHPIESSGDAEIDAIEAAISHYFNVPATYLKANYQEKLREAIAKAKRGDDSALAKLLAEFFSTLDETRLTALSDTLKTQVPATPNGTLKLVLTRLQWAAKRLRPHLASLASVQPEIRFTDPFLAEFLRLQERNRREFYGLLNDAAQHPDRVRAELLNGRKWDPAVLMSFLTHLGDSHLQNQLLGDIAFLKNGQYYLELVRDRDGAPARLPLGSDKNQLAQKLAAFSQDPRWKDDAGGGYHLAATAHPDGQNVRILEPVGPQQDVPLIPAPLLGTPGATPVPTGHPTATPSPTVTPRPSPSPTVHAGATPAPTPVPTIDPQQIRRQIAGAVQGIQDFLHRFLSHGSATPTPTPTPSVTPPPVVTQPPVTHAPPPVVTQPPVTHAPPPVVTQPPVTHAPPPVVTQPPATHTPPPVVTQPPAAHAMPSPVAPTQTPTPTPTRTPATPPPTPRPTGTPTPIATPTGHTPAPTPVPTTAAANAVANAARAVLSQYCFRCHGVGHRGGIQNILDREGLIRKDLLKPGDPHGSELLRVLTDGEMPPSGAMPTQAEIDTIRAWIAAGAPAMQTTPATPTPPPTATPTQPPAVHVPPAVTPPPTATPTQPPLVTPPPTATQTPGAQPPNQGVGPLAPAPLHVPLPTPIPSSPPVHVPIGPPQPTPPPAPFQIPPDLLALLQPTPTTPPAPLRLPSPQPPASQPLQPPVEGIGNFDPAPSPQPTRTPAPIRRQSPVTPIRPTQQQPAQTFPQVFAANNEFGQPNRFFASRYPGWYYDATFDGSVWRVLWLHGTPGNGTLHRLNHVPEGLARELRALPTTPISF
jgi:mono/diheme cytochrome c family protein